MARDNVDAWLVEPKSSKLIQRITAASAIEATANKIPMTSSTVSVPRSAAVAIANRAKGSAYTENGATDDEVILTARDLGTAFRIANEDNEDDTAVNIVASKRSAWASAYAVYLDNAALGVSAASNGTTIPFTSVYRSLSQSDSATGYTGGANLISTAGALTYTDLSDVVGRVEVGNFYNMDQMVVIAHPYFLGTMRGLVDGNSRPLFLETLTGQGMARTFMGMELRISQGAKVSATATATPSTSNGTTAGTAGNPLFIVANKDYLMLGERTPIRSRLLTADQGGPGALTNEDILIVDRRVGFALAHPMAAAAIEVTTA